MAVLRFSKGSHLLKFMNWFLKKVPGFFITHYLKKTKTLLGFWKGSWELAKYSELKQLNQFLRSGKWFEFLKRFLGACKISCTKKEKFLLVPGFSRFPERKKKVVPKKVPGHLLNFPEVPKRLLSYWDPWYLKRFLKRFNGSSENVFLGFQKQFLDSWGFLSTATISWRPQ